MKEILVKDGDRWYYDELIQCKDCYYFQRGLYNEEFGEWKWCMVHHGYTDEQGFCSKAERKEE